jgi:hypothetical protein
MTESPTHYSSEQVSDLLMGQLRSKQGLNELLLTCLSRILPVLTVPRAGEFLKHGIGRRLKLMRRCLEKVYEIYPPSRTTFLDWEELEDLQVYLHAYVINVAGILDNFAWVFVAERGLEQAIGGRKKVGLFIPATQQHLPAPFKDYITSATISDWYNVYAKEYRDALAHRIPLYVAPRLLDTSTDEHTRMQELSTRRGEAIVARDFQLADQLEAEEDSIGTPCPYFMHSFSEGNNARPVMFHPQVNSDASTIIEIGNRFAQIWTLTANQE